jgi:uncharacterized membrane protein YfcA
MKRSEKLIIGGVLAIILGIVVGLYLDPEISTGIISVGTAFIFIALFIKITKRDDELAHDERTKKIQSMSLANSWWLTYVLIAILFWVDRFYSLTAESILGILLFFMVITYALMTMYFQHKEVKY